MLCRASRPTPTGSDACSQEPVLHQREIVERSTDRDNLHCLPDIANRLVVGMIAMPPPVPPAPCASHVSSELRSMRPPLPERPGVWFFDTVQSLDCPVLPTPSPGSREHSHCREG